MAARPRSSFGAASAPATRASPVSIRKARQDYVATATEQTIDTADHSDTATSATVQVHLRLLPTDALLLRRLAGDRGQTLSGAIRYLLRREFQSGRKQRADRVED